MIDYLKALGPALIAILAISGIAATAASAQETQGHLTSATGVDMTLTGEDTGVSQNRRTIGTDITECPGSTYTGHNSSGGFLANGATEFTVTPHYKQTQTGGTANCDASGGLSVTIAMNGCDYKFHDFTTSGEVSGTYSLTTDIVCPTEKNIEVLIYTGHGHGFQICKEVVTRVTGLSGLHATTTAEHINLTGALTGFKVHRSGLCGTSEANGEYDLDVRIKAHNTPGQNIGVKLSDSDCL